MAEIIQQRILTPEEIRERTQSEHVSMLYFNYARTAASFFDVRLFFGQSSVTPKNEPTFEEQVCVVLSPEFAKTLRDNLTLAVDKYETAFGKIRPMPQPKPIAGPPQVAADQPSVKGQGDRKAKK